MPFYGLAKSFICSTVFMRFEWRFRSMPLQVPAAYADRPSIAGTFLSDSWWSLIRPSSSHFDDRITCVRLLNSLEESLEDNLLTSPVLLDRRYLACSIRQ